LPAVGQDSRDPVAGADPCTAQAALQAGNMGAQLGIGQLNTLTALVPADQRGLPVITLQQMLGVVQRGAAEPARPGHVAVFFEGAGGRGMQVNAEEFGQALPEVAALSDRSEERRVGKGCRSRRWSAGEDR